MTTHNRSFRAHAHAAPESDGRPEVTCVRCGDAVRPRDAHGRCDGCAETVYAWEEALRAHDRDGAGGRGGDGR